MFNRKINNSVNPDISSVDNMVKLRDAHTSKPPKKPRSRRKLISSGFFLLIIGILGGSAYAVMQMMMGPSEGTVINSRSETQIAAPQIDYEQFEGKYFTFAYPTSYVLQPDTHEDPISLESHTFLASSLMNKILTITISKLPSGKLDDDASYYMRSLYPNLYQLKPQLINGEKIVVAANTKEHQMVAFWVHPAVSGYKLLSFSLSSVSIDSQATDQEYQKMLESIKWR